MRKLKKEIKIGNVIVGGNSTIKIQSMTNTKTSNTESTIKQINSLEKIGCEIIRVAVTKIAIAGIIIVALIGIWFGIGFLLKADILTGFDLGYEWFNQTIANIF